jgi:hypothetical protein
MKVIAIAASVALAWVLCGVAVWLYRGRKWPEPPKERAHYWPDGRD